ncbi:MAG: hypothetical protein ACFFD6_04580 [Candidatus Thorarchaeota archaeon]
MARIPYCVVAGSAQDVEVPSQVAVNGHSQLERAIMVKTGLRSPKPVVVAKAYQTPISAAVRSALIPGRAAAYYMLK